MLSYKNIFWLSFLVLLPLFFACKPQTEEPVITKCLLTRRDGLTPAYDTLNKIYSTRSDAKAFDYNKDGKPTRFSFFTNSKRTGYEEVTYNSEGNLNSGTGYDSLNKKNYTTAYVYKDKKLITRNIDYLKGDLDYNNYTYDSLLRISTSQQITYETGTNDFQGTLYRYVYDSRSNCTGVFARTLVREFTTDFGVTKFVNDLFAKKEFLYIRFSDYDNNFNPFRSEENLAAIFDVFPSFNNARSGSYFIADGSKQFDVTFIYQYNEKKFPFLVTTQYVYPDKSKNFTTTESWEYNCK
jgi:hypothetical protein